PFGGCLPLFIQFPVLIVLYRLILGLTRTFILGFAVVVGTVVAAAPPAGGPPAGSLEGVSVQIGPNGHVSDGKLVKNVITDGTLDDAQAVVDGRVVGTVSGAKIKDGKIATAQVMNGKVLVGTLTDLTVTGGEVAGSPKNVPHDSSLYRALKESGGRMESWGMDLAKRASDTSGSEEIPFAILVVLVGATGFYQQRQLTARLPKESANSQMAVMGKIFPLVFVVISWTIPAGVVVYFLVSNIWQIGQQAFMFRNQPKPEPGPSLAAKSKKGPTPPAGKGKGKPTTTKGAKGAKALGGASGGAAKRGKSPANGKANAGKANAKKATGNKPNANKPNANKQRPDHGAPRPKSKPSRPEGRSGKSSDRTPRSDGRVSPENPAGNVKNDLPGKDPGGGGASPGIPPSTATGQYSGTTDKAVEGEE
ncbi:MAG: membrane protein insertase YidC, partial [Actinobacteria bacterium]|nr:membrane protein insertase YidC [Actinomycetota bacterium]